jgi:hypothetical protein
MTRLSGKRYTVPLLALFFGLFAAQDAHAQTVISGRVTNDAGAPIPGANVAIPSLHVGGQADASGNYRFTVPADRADCSTDRTLHRLPSADAARNADAGRHANGDFRSRL